MTYDDFRVVLVFRSELRPQAGELLVGRSALGDDSSVPSGVVVLSLINQCAYYQRAGKSTYHVEDDEWVARLPESRLNGSIISREELRIDCATNGGCHQLPRYKCRLIWCQHHITMIIPKASQGMGK